MPQAVIIVFLLMFAMLAFGWFYWQRAKTRSGGTVLTTGEPTEPTDSTAS